MTGSLAIEERLTKAGLTVTAGLVRPRTEAQLQSALQALREMRARVLWVGRESQVQAFVDAEQYDVRLTLRDLPQEVHLDAAEGVVRATTGVLWRDLQEQAAAQGQVLSPDLGPDYPGTLGGVIAAGFSGPDRAHYGALRHQVLGTRVILSDGRQAPFGAPLVKNVTGFAVPPMMVGQRGRVAGLTEVSLRLWPAPAARVAWQFDPETWLTAWQRMRAAHLPYLSFRATHDPQQAVLAFARGTRGAMQDVQGWVRSELGAEPIPAQDLESAWARSWRVDAHARSVIVQCLPKDFPSLWETLTQTTLPWSGHIDWMALPDEAEVRGRWQDSPQTAARTALAKHLAELPCRWRFLGAKEPKPLRGGPAPPAGLTAAQRALRHAWDPIDLWQPHPPAAESLAFPTAPIRESTDREEHSA